MGFKKHNWMPYNGRGMKVEMKVLDEDNRSLDFFRWVVSDKVAEKNIGSILKRKYGVNLSTKMKSYTSTRNE